MREGRPDHAAAGYQRGRLLELPLVTRARALAVSTAEEASRWSDRLAAARVLSEAADLLWDDDPEQCRAWLTQAWELTDAIAYGEGDKGDQGYRGNSPKGRSRSVILSVAQRHDKALADFFLEKLANEAERTDTESRRGVFDDRTPRSEQLLNLALSVVESDPEGAASLAERSLVDGISFQLQRVLLALWERDRRAANRVLDAALLRLAAGFKDPSEAQVIASYFFTPGRVFNVGNQNNIVLAVSTRTRREAQTPAEAEPARARRFLAIMQHILLSLPAPSATANPPLQAQRIVTLAHSLEKGFRLYAEDLWLPIEHRLAMVRLDLSTPLPDGGLPQIIRERMQSGAVRDGELDTLYVAELEAKAEKEADPLARKFAYLQAALATVPEDLARGLSLAAKISEDALRQQVIAFLKYRAALVALEKGRIEESLALAEGTEPLQRVVLLITAAQRITEEGTRETDEQAMGARIRALQLLSDAEKALGGDKRSDVVLRLRLGIVVALARLDKARAINSLKEVVAEVNKAKSFDPTDASPPRVTGLYSFSVQSSLPRIKSGYGLRDAFTLLAPTEFDESIYVADKLNVPTTRGLCMLEIVRSVLADERREK